jgi:hypothetical protein
MTAQFRNIVTCIFGALGYTIGCFDNVPATQLVLQAASECNTPVPTLGDYALMGPNERMVFMQTQKAAQENVAHSISSRDEIRPCDAAWALAPR